MFTVSKANLTEVISDRLAEMKQRIEPLPEEVFSNISTFDTNRSYDPSISATD